MISSLIGFLFVLCIVGAILWGLWALAKYVPMPQPLRIVVTVVFVVICILIVWHFLPLELLSGLSSHGRP